MGLSELLDTTVQITKDWIAICDDLAVEFQDDPEHAMGARMLGAHIEHKLVGSIIKAYFV